MDMNPDAYIAGSARIARLLESEVMPAVGARAGQAPGADSLAVFRRMFRIFQSIVSLGGPDHYESAASLAATLFERYMDLELLAGDESGDMLRRHREFVEIQRFRAAHRIAEFHEESGGGTPLDAGEQLRFREITGGIQEIRKKVIEVWGPDNRGKGSYPVHWSGRKCTRQISQDMGVEYEQLYIEAYSVLSWLIHSGMSGGGEPDAALQEEIFAWCHGIAQLVMLEGARTCLEACGAAAEIPWLDRAVDFLRKTPGAALTAAWFDPR